MDLWTFLRTCAVQEELQGIELTAVDEDFVVEVIASGSPGRARVANHVAAADQIARVHAEAVEMRVARRDPETVADDDHVAVRARRCRSLDGAVGRRVDRLALVGGNVEPRVELAFAG